MGFGKFMDGIRDSVHDFYRPRSTPTSPRTTSKKAIGITASVAVPLITLITYLSWPSGKPTEEPVHDIPAGQAPAAAPVADAPGNRRATPVVPGTSAPASGSGSGTTSGTTETQPPIPYANGANPQGAQGEPRVVPGDNTYSGYVTSYDTMGANSARIKIRYEAAGKELERTFTVRFDHVNGNTAGLEDMVNGVGETVDTCKTEAYKNKLCISRYLAEVTDDGQGNATAIDIKPEVVFNGKRYTSLEGLGKYVASLGNRIKTISDPRIMRDFQKGIDYHGKSTARRKALKELGDEFLAAFYALAEYQAMPGVEMQGMPSWMAAALKGGSKGETTPGTKDIGVIDVMYRGAERTMKVVDVMERGFNKLF